MRSQTETFSISIGSYSIELCVLLEPQHHSIFSILYSLQSAYLFVFLFFVYVSATSCDSYAQEAGQGWQWSLRDRYIGGQINKQRTETVISGDLKRRLHV